MVELSQDIDCSKLCSTNIDWSCMQVVARTVMPKCIGLIEVGQSSRHIKDLLGCIEIGINLNYAELD